MKSHTTTCYSLENVKPLFMAPNFRFFRGQVWRLRNRWR